MTRVTDSGWLALQSWTGDSRSPETAVFVDVFNLARGERVLTIEGIYRGQDYPEAYFGKSACLLSVCTIAPLAESCHSPRRGTAAAVFQ